MDAVKRELRDRVRELRRAISEGDRVRASAAASSRVLALPQAQDASMVLAYGAMAEEIDPGPALDVLRARGAQIALPRIAGHGLLTLHLVRDVGDLERGPFGLTQPHETAPAIEPQAIDLAIVPGVAFDRRGHRLGLGGGFYDRLLGALRDPQVAVGYGFDEQLVDLVPTLPHDLGVGVVVTPSNTVIVTQES